MITIMNTIVSFTYIL